MTDRDEGIIAEVIRGLCRILGDEAISRRSLPALR